MVNSCRAGTVRAVVAELQALSRLGSLFLVCTGHWEAHPNPPPLSTTGQPIVLEEDESSQEPDFKNYPQTSKLCNSKRYFKIFFEKCVQASGHGKGWESAVKPNTVTESKADSSKIQIATIWFVLFLNEKRVFIVPGP